ncbi:MAG: DUF2029 domain-containing protein [candidate division Zixibacteria bacterium]|nr:DUF2029 domain-containing protein [candidate division Zixibacteria bacterium]NIR63959.1 DUF2029 domain-containing protein [candidate division Zixibacteria bacterium]NIS15251.1 DUF2029 domain-containing protein [candidate division Zixibacteria bacterium]NIS45879.1 DUF2029 domain-containing protein [candidate division Zixibacteria bacterium]NIT51781.1 DUF2029 domain-containing protein [candidate division Zixibacteria bacterium]
MKPRRAETTILAAISILFAGLLLYFASDTYYQWDFKTYFYASRLEATGGNPFDHEALRHISDNPRIHPFIYPPLLLKFFRVFSIFPYEIASVLWISVKALCLVLLLFIWCKKFLTDEKCWLVFLFAFFAFGSALFLDFKTGNIAVIMQLFLWSGFYFLLRGKPLLFIIMIVLASLFKLTPLVFLFLLPLLLGTRGYKYLASGILGFAAILILDYFAEKDNFVSWIETLAMPAERGSDYNPSSLALSKDLSDVFGMMGLNNILPDSFPWILFLLMTAAVLIIALKFIPWQKLKSMKDGRLQIIYMSCLIYAMIMPRFKTYSFILLIPPVLYLIRRFSKRLSFPLMFILVSLSTNPPLPKLYLTELFWTYYPLLIVYSLWLIWVYFINRNSADARQF